MAVSCSVDRMWCGMGTRGKGSMRRAVTVSVADDVALAFDAVRCRSPGAAPMDKKRWRGGELTGVGNKD